MSQFKNPMLDMMNKEAMSNMFRKNMDVFSKTSKMFSEMIMGMMKNQSQYLKETMETMGSCMRDMSSKQNTAETMRNAAQKGREHFGKTVEHHKNMLQTMHNNASEVVHHLHSGLTENSKEYINTLKHKNNGSKK